MSPMTLATARDLDARGEAVLVETGTDTSSLPVGSHVWATLDALDPGHNVRSRLPKEHRSRLVASVREDGVQQEILAYPTLTGLVVLDGHRRLDAARRAGLEVVPVRVVDETAGVEGVERARRQLVLNDTAENLTVGDRVKALALFSRSGMPRRRLHRIADREEVAAAVTLDQSGTDVDALAHALPTLSLTDLAAVAELAADEDCDLSEEDMVAEITRDPGRRDQLIALWQEEARRVRLVRLRREELAARGIRVLTRAEQLRALDAMSDARLLSVLADGQTGHPLDEAAHEACPAHAVGTGWSFAQDAVVVHAYCMDPDTCGHLPLRSTVAARLRGEDVPDAAPPRRDDAPAAPDDSDDAGGTPEDAVDGTDGASSPTAVTSGGSTDGGDGELAAGPGPAGYVVVEDPRDIVAPPEVLHRQRSEAAAAARRRRELLVRLLRSATTSSTTLTGWAVRYLLEVEHPVAYLHSRAGVLLGSSLVSDLAGISPGRPVRSLSLWLLALAAADVEDRLLVGDYWTPDHSATEESGPRAAYLRGLAEAGYELSDPERAAVLLAEVALAEEIGEPPPDDSDSAVGPDGGVSEGEVAGS